MIQISQANELGKVSNYKKELKEIDVPEYVIKYLSVVLDFIDNAKQERYKYKKEYLQYILKQGFQTMKHIFLYMLLYTKNIDLSFFNLQKGLYYYLEFIQQIKRDEHQFLQFNIKDAIIFVYKKTIYEVDQDYVRSMIVAGKDQYIIERLRTYIEGWNQFIYDLIQMILYTPELEDVNHKEVVKLCIVFCKTQFDKGVPLHYDAIVQELHKSKSSFLDEFDSIIKNIHRYRTQ